jgi:8-oxo-dGTP diphosphatase
MSAKKLNYGRQESDLAIRNSVKAIIMEEDRLLLTKNQDKEGFFYLFPGGGQELGENFHDTLQRECLEEIGLQVEIGELKFIREYIGKNHEYAATDSAIHQVEFYLKCQLKKGEKEQEPITNLIDRAIPTNPDESQVGVEWVPIRQLMDYRLYPKEIRGHIIEFFQGNQTRVYLGDIN